MAIFFILGGGTGYFFFSKESVDPKKTLRVMTYSSFVNVFGPGQEIKKKFEQICSCQVKWIKVPDSTLFVQRLSLRKDGFKTDVVLGLDQLSFSKVESPLQAPVKHSSPAKISFDKNHIQNLPWKKTIVEKKLFILPVRKFLSEYFVPYNWSPMSFISRKKMVTLSLLDLLDKKFKHDISLPSPRSSTVGLQFYYWIWWVFKDKTGEFLKSFKNRLYGLPPSWSTSYSLFQRGHVGLSFSYLSSLLYHRDQKQKDFYFVRFKEGHPFQVERAGVSGFCKECELAQQFVRFLLKPAIQNILKNKNYMFPVVSSAYSHSKDPLIKSLSPKDLISYDQLDIFFKNREKRLKEWEKFMK